MRRFTLLLLLIPMALPASASAAVLYTSPTGSGSVCSQAVPCALKAPVGDPSALSLAVSGDEIRLTADEYNLTSQLVVSTPNLTISGPPGRYEPSDPQAFLRFPSLAFSNILVQVNNFALRRVSVTGAAGGQVLINSSNGDNMVLDRVMVLDNGSASSVLGQDVQISNSVIRQISGSDSAVEATGSIAGSTITSVTADAISNNNAFHDARFGDYCDLQILNTIAIGFARNLHSIKGSPTSTCSPTINYAYSWIPTFGTGGGIEDVPLIDGGPFITSGDGILPDDPPAMSAPFSGNINLALNSTAVNSGCGGSCGIEDFYGRPRPIGAGNDVGATETILPPSVSNVNVGAVTSTSASVSASLNPNGGATAYEFRYRKSGDATWVPFSVSASSDGASAISVPGQASSLEPETDYEVRIVASNPAGSAASATLTSFRTASPSPNPSPSPSPEPGPGPGPGPGPEPGPSLAVSFLEGKATKRSAYITSKVTVSGSGKISQRATTGKADKLKTWCKASRTVTASGAYTLKCNLGTKGRKYLKKKSLKLTLRTAFTPTVGSAVYANKTLTIKRQR